MFKKAEKSQVKLKMLLTGISGTGKTYTALTVAKGMGAKKIVVLDSENGSASLYADLVDFDTCDIAAPYTTEKYITALKQAQKEGYDVIIVDSISHQWAGDGGLMSQKERLDASGKGNSYTNFAKITPVHEQFKAAILGCRSHVICTVRSKQDYFIEPNEKGKMAPRKVGLAPIQREGLEYEYDLVLDLDMDHQASASKDRTRLFDGKLFKPTAETGKQLVSWLSSGKPLSKAEPTDEPPHTEEKAQLWSLLKDLQVEHNIPAAEFKSRMQERFKVGNLQALGTGQLKEYIREVQDLFPKQKENHTA